MSTEAPPFRYDHVGSFLRPARLADRRKAFADGQCSAAALREVEDECIRELIGQQERVGLKGVTGGEFRRTYFHIDFLEKLEGVKVSYGEFTNAFRKDDGSKVGFAPPTMHIGRRIGHARPIQGADFDYLNSVTKALGPPGDPVRDYRRRKAPCLPRS